MEISTAAPPSLSLPTTNNTPKSPDTDHAETPTTRIQPTKSLPFTNGVLKRHAPPHLQHYQPPPATPPPPVSYKECMKNHAASRGGYAIDGCGEFMPSPAAVSSDPTSLKCAACGCHRNFHRREPLAEDQHALPLTATPAIEYHPQHRHHPPPPPPHGVRSPNSQSPPPISSSYYPSSAPHMLLALSGGGGSNPAAGIDALNSPHGTTPFQQSRKRFRTKFTQDQKDKMLGFAEKLGWKMQKTSDDLVAEFCREIGVERGVFKVWMHNNKNTFGRKDLNAEIADRAAPSAAAVTGVTANLNENNGSSGNSGNNDSHGYSKNGDGTYGSSTSS